MKGVSLDEFCKVLAGAQLNDRPAVARLHELEKDTSQFLSLLARVVGDSTRPSNVRQMAGLRWLHFYDPIAEGSGAEREEVWLQLDTNVRTTLKEQVWNGLTSADSDVNRVSGRIIAQIALIELPGKHWPNLMRNLQEVIKTHEDPKLKAAALACIGCICEAVSELEQQDTLLVLDVVLFAMRKEMDDVEVILAASTAFSQAIKLLGAHMSEQKQRDHIMKTVCLAAQIPSSPKIRAKAMENIGQLSLLHYEHMAPYIRHIIAIFTACLAKHDDDGEQDESAALHAVEIWSGLCDLEEEQCAMNELDDSAVFHDFIATHVGDLVGPLLKIVTRKQLLAEQDSGVWDLSECAVTCLSLIAKTTTAGSEIMSHVLPFVKQFIKGSARDTEREAACRVFGSVLDGPETDDTGLDWVFASLVDMLENDKEAEVRDSAAFALSRVCEFHAPAITEEAKLARLVPALCKAAKTGRPSTASLACLALGNIANGCEGRRPDEDSPFDKYFKTVVGDLIAAGERKDVDDDDDKLSLVAFGAIGDVVRNAAECNLMLINDLCNSLLLRLRQSLSAADESTRSQRQGHLCTALFSIVSRLNEAIKPYAKDMLALFLTILGAADADNHTIYEDVFLVVGPVANALGADFKPYVKGFMPFLIRGVTARGATSLCTVSLGTIGDIFRSVNSEIADVCDCDAVMRELLRLAYDVETDRSVKPHICDVIGDFALALGEAFSRFFGPVVAMLLMAAAVQKRGSDDDEPTPMWKRSEQA